MSEARWIRLGSVVVLSLVLGCGGGGGDGYDDGISRGTLYTNVDIFTESCGPTVYEVMGSDVFELEEDRIRLVIYVDATSGCAADTLEIYGTRTGPTTIDVDDVPLTFLCALEAQHGYGAFTMTNCVYTEEPAYDRITADLAVDYDGAPCEGQIIITLTDR